MNRILLWCTAALLSACAGEPPAPLAVSLPPPPPEPQAKQEPPAPPPAEAPAPVPPQPRPAQTDHGPWCVVVASELSAADTAPWVKRLEGAGFRVETGIAEVGGKTWHRVLLPGYRKAAEARAVLPLANQAAGVSDSFVWRRVKTASTAPAAAPTPTPAPAPQKPVRKPAAPSATPKPSPTN